MAVPAVTDAARLQQAPKVEKASEKKEQLAQTPPPKADTVTLSSQAQKAEGAPGLETAQMAAREAPKEEASTQRAEIAKENAPDDKESKVVDIMA